VVRLLVAISLALSRGLGEARLSLSGKERRLIDQSRMSSLFRPERGKLFDRELLPQISVLCFRAERRLDASLQPAAMNFVSMGLCKFEFELERKRNTCFLRPRQRSPHKHSLSIQPASSAVVGCISSSRSTVSDKTFFRVERTGDFFLDP
jgi:hypothetical protein